MFNWIMCVRVRVRARVKFFSCASVMFRNRNVAQESACRAESHAIRASTCRWLCAYLLYLPQSTLNKIFKLCQDFYPLRLLTQFEYFV